MAFLIRKNPDAAAQAGRLLADAGDSLSAFPRRGVRVAGPDERELRCLIKRDYAIYYVIGASSVSILRIMHGREDRS